MEQTIAMKKAKPNYMLAWSNKYSFLWSLLPIKQQNEHCNKIKEVLKRNTIEQPSSSKFSVTYVQEKVNTFSIFWYCNDFILGVENLLDSHLYNTL